MGMAQSDPQRHQQGKQTNSNCGMIMLDEEHCYIIRLQFPTHCAYYMCDEVDTSAPIEATVFRSYDVAITQALHLRSKFPSTLVIFDVVTLAGALLEC